MKKEPWFKRFYHEVISLSTILKNSNGTNRRKIIFDLLLLIIITCFLKIPFIFIRDLGDQAIETFLASNVSISTLWGFFIELCYVIVAFTFFIKTFYKWFAKLDA